MVIQVIAVINMFNVSQLCYFSFATENIPFPVDSEEMFVEEEYALKRNQFWDIQTLTKSLHAVYRDLDIILSWLMIFLLD